jgi:NAD+ dependent glucose-6-phosphate dehydrogenase
VVNELPKYHLAAQDSDTLLAPIQAILEELEQRTQHYLDRINVHSPEDEQALRTANEAIAQARLAITEATNAKESPEASPEPAKTRQKRVLITGAGGWIGNDLAERLRDRYSLRLMYHHRIPEQPPVDDWVQPDTSSVDELTAAMEGIDAVVHMAADPSTDAPWKSVLQNNIVATYNVFEAARRAGVKRIVFASTNHVMGMYDRDSHWPIYADQPVRPDSLYGVSKAFGEALGRYWTDQHGISVICLRIGWMTPEPKNEISTWMWLSPRDCAQVVSRALDTDLGFGIFYAISGNSGRHWDITDTIERLGYRPEDDAARFLAERTG